MATAKPSIPETDSQDRKLRQREASRKYERSHRETRRAESRAYYHANKERRAAYNKQWSQDHAKERKAYHRAYDQQHKDRKAAQRKEHYQRHKDEQASKNAAYRQAHKEALHLRQQQYQQQHKTEIAARKKQAYQKDPTKPRAAARRWRALRKGAHRCDLTATQWAEIKAAYGHRCVYCGRKMQRLTQDHITPLSKGGDHTLWNVVPACLSCNSKKNAGPVLKPVQPLLL